MIDTILSFPYEFRQNFRIADGVDMLLMAVFLYSALVWFRETGSRSVLIGVSVLLIVYFLARAFDLYLTSLVFHTGFAVLVIVVIVVFQEDLRRMFERVAGWGSLERFRSQQEFPIEVNALVEAVFNMAGLKTGALIVLEGSEPLERHLDGGVLLGGRISKPLIYSLFDADSPGHDGAVVIQDKRVSKFAVHLPISKNHQEIAGRGTRHSAALGLSECCDALTIVVSEERGVVSITEAGKLLELSTAAALKNQIESFFNVKFPKTTQSVWRRFVVQHWPLKMFSVVLSVVAWFTLAYNPSTIQRTFVVPIEYRNLSKDVVLDNRAPNEARVTLSGSERNFRFVDPGTLKISVDLASAKRGFESINITDQNIRLPAHVTMYRIEPRVLYLNLSEPVDSRLNGEPVRAK